MYTVYTLSFSSQAAEGTVLGEGFSRKIRPICKTPAKKIGEFNCNAIIQFESPLRIETHHSM